MIKRLVAYYPGTKYKAKNGKEYDDVNYYLELDNGNRIAVRPSFDDGYSQFRLIAEVERKIIESNYKKQ